MANIDGAFGMRAIKSESGTAPKLETFTVKNAVTIYQGEPCCLDATGQVVAYTNTLALTGSVIGAANNYALGATGTVDNIQVYTDPAQLYEMQADDNSLSTVTAWRGTMVRFITPASGNGTTLQSIAEIDGSSGVSSLVEGVTSITPIRIDGISKRVSNETNTSWTIFNVRFVPPVHHRGMPVVGIEAQTGVFTGLA